MAGVAAATQSGRRALVVPGHDVILPHHAGPGRCDNGLMSVSRLDAVAAAAVDIAEAAARELGGDGVGAHLGARADGERVVTPRLAAAQAGYTGWYWAVTVARASRAKTVTVDEVVLLPGEDALLAPEWVPWAERLRPDDLAPGDVLPTPGDDPRLVPGYLASGDESVDDVAVTAVATELFLGRPRVLSAEGRDDASDRWQSGEHGPDSAMAQAAAATCESCGFLMALSGTLRGAFGVCANEFSPADGAVVAADFGCGAHSEAIAAATPDWPTPEPGEIYDDDAIDITVS